MGYSWGFFEGGGGDDLFDPKIALRFAQDTWGVKKASAPMKNPEMPHDVCREKNITDFQN
jgi:hypothetical protein